MGNSGGLKWHTGLFLPGVAEGIAMSPRATARRDSRCGRQPLRQVLPGARRPGGGGIHWRPSARRRLAIELLEARTLLSVSVQNLAGPLEPSDLAQFLAGPGISVSNVRYTGVEVAGGTFSGGGGLGLDAGIILSSGNVAHLIGPNVLDGVTGDNGTIGDADLDAISGFTTYDAAVLEFDFVPAGDVVTFRYVFASDEYNEWVNSAYNDTFAFFVNDVNYATVGAGQPVSVNTINNGKPFGSDPRANPSLYRNNDLDDGGGSIGTEMDGLTVVLTLTAPVDRDVTNRMKLAIADASDHVWDSNVLIGAGTFRVADLDFGDAPDTYQTSLGSNGARHSIVPALFLGAGVDDEEDGQPSAGATGDGSDEDGVVFATPLLPGGEARVTVTASEVGLLDSWVDFNRNGHFEAQEKLLGRSIEVAAGVNPITFLVPAWAAPGETYARFRFSRQGELSPVGLAADGEVEDYAVAVEGKLHLEKTLDPEEGRHGELISTFVDITFTPGPNSPAAGGLDVVDPLCGGSLTLIGGDDGDRVLQPSETWRFSGAFTVPAHRESEDNPLVTTATATGVIAGGVFSGTELPAVTGAAELELIHNELGAIHGSKFNDLDGDGAWGADEPSLQGWTIYLDANFNGQFDGGEPYDVTDEDGEYAFTDLPAGTYAVAEIGQDGWEQTTPMPPGYWVVLEAGEVFGTTPDAVVVTDGSPNWVDQVPGPAVDETLAKAVLEIDLTMDGQIDGIFDLSGQLTVDRLDPLDTNSDGVFDTIPQEIVGLELTGLPPTWGPNRVRLGSGPSLGAIHQSPGMAVADSYFDVFFDIDVQGISGDVVTVHNETPLNLRSAIDGLPQYGAVFEDGLRAPLPLKNDQGVVCAQLLAVRFTPLFGLDFGNRQIIPAGVTITESDQTTDVAEGGTTDTYTVVLDSRPTHDVTIMIVPDNSLEVWPATLTFNSEDWSAPQIVTVSAIDDHLYEGRHAAAIGHSVASSDSRYQGIAIAGVAAGIADNDDPPEVTLSLTGSPMPETEGAATVAVTLSAPAGVAVTVDLAFSGSAALAADYTRSGNGITIPAGSTIGTITLTTVHDTVAEANETIVVDIQSVANGTESGAQQVTATIADDDTPGIAVSPAFKLVTTESGGIAAFSMVLTGRPTADVVVSLSSSDTTEVNVGPASVRFTPDNWSMAQTVTVSGVNDFIDDGNVSCTIVTAAAVSADPAYQGLDPADVAVMNVDDDAAGISITPTAGLATTEAGGTASFTIVLTSQPAASVTVGLTSSDTSEGTISASRVSFDAENWNVPQTVTVTGVDDPVADGDVAYTIVTARATSSDRKYDRLDPADVSMVNTSDDIAGISIAAAAGLMTSEAGGRASFTIVLTSQPVSNVEIRLSSSDITEGVVSPGRVIFTPSNWNIPRTATVTGVDDAVLDPKVSFSVLISAAISSDPYYCGVASNDIPVTNQDDEIPSGSVAEASLALGTSQSGGTAGLDGAAVGSLRLTGVPLQGTGQDSPDVRVNGNGSVPLDASDTLRAQQAETSVRPAAAVRRASRGDRDALRGALFASVKDWFQIEGEAVAPSRAARRISWLFS